jgi:hypothetical protein
LVVVGVDIVVVVDEGVELVVLDEDSRFSEQLATVKTAKARTANSTWRRIDEFLPTNTNRTYRVCARTSSERNPPAHIRQYVRGIASILGWGGVRTVREIIS